VSNSGLIIIKIIKDNTSLSD